MTHARYIVGDVRDVLATIPTGSVDLVLTSPPFLALRSYLPADHPDKHREIGSEPDPATFLDTLLLLTAEFGRVLAPHGSICVELGDTYAGSGGAGGDYNPDGLRDGQNGSTGSASRGRVGRVGKDRHPDGFSGRSSHGAPGGSGWPLPKSLCGIPHLYHLSLAYGRNLLTGEESPAGRWRVRNVVAWCRPNPPVGALGDKFRPATSYMTIATRAQRRYFDLDAVRTAYDGPPPSGGTGMKSGVPRAAKGLESNPAGAPPLDYWVIPTQPYSGSHYAVYPPALCERPIKAMCPAKVCTVCGAPSERIVETTNAVGKAVGRAAWRGGTDGIGSGHSGDIALTANDPRVPDVAIRETLGWTDCGHDSWRPGVVLDPFAGSGTTLMVANELERDAIGFDLDERNASLARDRVDKFLFSDFRALSLDEFMEGAALLAPKPSL